MHRDYFIHLGPHKTGTTHFQRFLEANESQLLEMGFDLVTVRSQHAPDYLEARKRYTRFLQGWLIDEGKQARDSGSEFSGAVVELLAGLQHLTKPKVILSDENLLGPMPGHYFAGGRARESQVYPACSLVVNGFQAVLGPHLKSILLCRRDPYDLILSAYRDQLTKLERAETPLEFFRALAPQFSENVESFFQAFNKVDCRIEVIPFQQLVTDQSGTAANFLNTELIDPALPEGESNPSIGWSAVDEALRLLSGRKLEAAEKIHWRRRLLKTTRAGGTPKWIETELQEIWRSLTGQSAP